MTRDYTDLRKKILGTFGALAPFADALGVTPSTLSIKLAGKSDWSRAEIETAQALLDLTPDEVLNIFF